MVRSRCMLWLDFSHEMLGSLVGGYRRFGGICYLYLQSPFCLVYGDTKFCQTLTSEHLLPRGDHRGYWPRDRPQMLLLVMYLIFFVFSEGLTLLVAVANFKSEVLYILSAWCGAGLWKYIEGGWYSRHLLKYQLRDASQLYNVTETPINNELTDRLTNLVNPSCTVLDKLIIP
jgi:hypothetical protein